MKKKGMLLGALLMGVAITGYSVSGTYAKYTTTMESETAKARVAQWSFDMNDAIPNFISNLFKDSYTNVDGKNIVKSLTGCTTNPIGTEICDDVIAPGTSGKYSFQLSGTTETNYTLSFAATSTNSAILTQSEIINLYGNPIAAGAALNLTTGMKDADGNEIKGYNPLQFRVYAGREATTIPPIAWETWSDENITNALNKLVQKDGEDIVYGPTSSNDLGVYTIEWRWAFEQKTKPFATDAEMAMYDKLDTALGNKIYNILDGKVEGKTADDVSVDLKVAVTATQSQKAVTE